MSEPTLSSIEDYDTLKGEKKKVVLSVIFAGLIIGIIYSVAYSVYDNKEDTIRVQESINHKIPVK